MADNITPLIPMTAASMALLSDEERRDYWLAVARKWEINAAAAKDREYKWDYAEAQHTNEWCGS